MNDRRPIRHDPSSSPAVSSAPGRRLGDAVARRSSLEPRLAARPEAPAAAVVRRWRGRAGGLLVLAAIAAQAIAAPAPAHADAGAADPHAAHRAAMVAASGASPTTVRHSVPPTLRMASSTKRPVSTEAITSLEAESSSTI